MEQNMDWLTSYGVVDYGYTEESIPTTLDHYNQWVSDKKHFPLTYLEGERQEKRQDLKKHWIPFQSALVFLFSYHPAHYELQQLKKNNPDWNGLSVASYTLGFNGEDYHESLREKLEGIGKRLESEFNLEYRLTLDTHPVLERDLAKRAGLGWFGKNSMLINRHHGSFFIIGSLLLNKKLDISPKTYETDHCGQCNKCVEACPTTAIDPLTRTIIAKDCISTFTIEQFKLETVPSEKMDLKEGTIFGCDICQDVCPWNKRIDRAMTFPLLKWNEKHQKILNFFLLRPIEVILEDLEKKTGGEFERFFHNTSFFRSGKRGILKNIKLYIKQKKLF